MEDDKDINEYNTKSAYSGTEALLLHDKSINLIILDLMLPGKNGEEIIKKLKKRKNIPDNKIAYGNPCKVVRDNN